MGEKSLTKKKHGKKIKLCREDRIYYGICYTVATILAILVLYPVIYIVSCSFSSGAAVGAGKVWLWPVDFSLVGYKAILKYKDVWIGYRNTIFYTFFGTVISIAMTMMCAYPLSRKNLRGRRFIMLYFTFTMLFGGGMIPSYLLIKKLKMLNTIWAMLIPGCMSVYNMIVARTFIQSNIPDELQDAAKIDGCSDSRFFTQIVLPLSKAILAVLALWYAVGQWNSYFNAFLYLTDKELYPLQIFLKQVLVQSQMTSEMVTEDFSMDAANTRQLLKYSMIVISTAPLFVAYPFVQKYFIKGVMIGSIKG